MRAMAFKSENHLRYRPPDDWTRLSIQEVLQRSGKSTADDRQLDMLRSYGTKDAYIYCAGDLRILEKKCVSIVGTRECTDEGWTRSSRLGRELAAADVSVMSGIAKGIDTAALSAAIEAGGRVAGVIGTPLNKAYPAENADLHEVIYRNHLLISPFAEGEKVFKSNFPKRNRVMALLSNATVIVEASDTSGTLHQAAECVRQNRWLFILKSVADNERLKWPKDFLGKPKVAVLTNTDQLLEAIA